MEATPLPVATLNLVAEAGSAGFTTDLPLTFSWDVASDSRVAGYSLTVSDATTGASASLKTVNDANQRTTQIIDAEELSGEAYAILKNASRVRFNLSTFTAEGESGSISIVEWMRPTAVIVTEGEIDPFGESRGGDEEILDDGEDDEFDEDSLE